MDKLATALRVLGLATSQQRTYLALLEHGNIQAHELARRTGLPRATIHDALERLIAHGLASFTVVGRRRRYAPTHPDHFEAMVRSRERQLSATLPELTSLYHATGRRPYVTVFSGPAKARAIHELTLSCRSKLLRGIISLPTQNATVGASYMIDFIRRRAAGGIQARLISAHDRESERAWNSSRGQLREAKFAPDGMSFPLNVYIYDSTVSFVGTRRENFGVVLESSEFAATAAALFEVLWQVSRAAPRLD